MSRRDDALSAVDDLVATFRSHLAAALEGEHPPRLPRRSSDAPYTPTHSLPAASYSAPPTPAAAPPITSFLRQPLGVATPFSAGASHTSYPLEAPPPPAAAPTSDSTSGNGEALPGYSRRAPTAPYLTSNLPPKRRHVLASKTGKLHLELHARGKDQLVLVQEEPDGDVTLDGALQVVLRDPETITHIRVRLKGMVRTLVQKAHASGRHPVSDEVDFFEDGRVLWAATHVHGGLPQRLPGNTSSDPLKVQGTFNFPFSLTLPGRLTRVPAMDLPPGRAIRPPPSFVLDSATAQQPAGGGLTTGVGAFEASCRYYLKVTLGRKGLLKMNERWVVPVVFVPRQPMPLTPSPLRALALQEGRRPPLSASDPQGWSDAGRYVARAATKRGGVWKTRAGWVEVEGRVPRPQKFVKGQGQQIDFEVQITSNADSGRFPASAVAVSLLQRTVVSAQRLVNTLDTVVLRAQAVRPIGAPEGLPLQLGNGAQAWRVTYGGSITLTQGMTASFRAPNLQVLYELCVTLYAPGPRPDVPSHTHLASLAIPVEIVSCAPPPPPPAPAPLPGHGDGDNRPVASGSTAPAPVPPAGGAVPPALPPRKDAAPARPAAAAPPPAPAPAAVAADAEEERRLEAEWGMPPAYYDVVAEEGGRVGGRRG